MWASLAGNWPTLTTNMAYVHETGWQPPDGKRLVKSHRSRSAEGIAMFVEACRTLAREFYAKYGLPKWNFSMVMEGSARGRRAARRFTEIFRRAKARIFSLTWRARYPRWGYRRRGGPGNCRGVPQRRSKKPPIRPRTRSRPGRSRWRANQLCHTNSPSHFHKKGRKARMMP